MIRQEISKQIWNKKYRDGEESEEHFYARIPVGLFKNTSLEDIEIFNKILGCDVRQLTNEKLKSHKCFLAGRGMYAIGTEKSAQTFSNCFVIPIKKDSMDGIMNAVKQSAMTMKAGGGVGYSISILRPSTVKISTSNSFSSGAVSFLKIFDSTCSVIKAGGDRRGAQMVAMGVWHPSIKEFITAKRSGELTNFNMSVFVSNKFMKAVRNNEDWDLIFPDVTCSQYNEEWDGNIKLWKEKGYPVIVHDTVNAKELFDLIMESNYKFAEPGILFEDIINERNTLWWNEYIQTTNPCVTGDTLVDTDRGKISIKYLIENGIENYKAESVDTETGVKSFENISFGDRTRINANVIEIETEDGQTLKLTPDHKVFTNNRGYVEAAKLTVDDDIVVNG